MYAIVTYDYLKEYKGRNKKGERIFVERTVPHQGKRYKRWENAIAVASDIYHETGTAYKVVETII